MRRPMRMRGVCLLVASALAAGAGAGGARASIWIADSAREPALRVNAQGYAEVGWTAPDGSRRYLLAPPEGKVLPGGRLQGPDVSTAAGVSLALARVVRRTPDGTLWALQEWRVKRNGPRALRLSRWKGAPTELILDAVCCRLGSETLQGRASFHGRPVFGTSPTPEGKQVRLVVYVDCFACPASPRGWGRLSGVPTRAPDGSFSLWIRPPWRGERYRATIAGPNLGRTLAPDAQAVVASALG